MKRISPQADAAVRVYVNHVPWYPAKRQRIECAAFGAGIEFDDFDAWVRHARGRDTMIVASLRLLHDGKRGPVRPGPQARFRQRLAAALAGGTVIEAATGITSADKAQWATAVRAALAFLKAGGHMVGETAKARARKGAAKGGAVIKARSAEQRWAAEPKLREDCRVIWQSRLLRGETERLARVNEYLASIGRAAMQFGSTDTARRTLGKVRS